MNMEDTKENINNSNTNTNTINSFLENGLNELKSISEVGFLSKDFFLENIKTIGVVLLLVLISTSNRYTCQKQMAEIEKLKKELKDTRFEALTRSSELIGVSRPSQVRALVKKHGIEIFESDKPAYRLKD